MQNEIRNMGEDKPLKCFQDLNAWQESRKLYRIIFQATKLFPKEEVFSSVSQMRRAALSVCSNLAEGFGRSTIPDKVHFYIMARGSLTELQNQIILVQDVAMMPTDTVHKALLQAEVAHKLIVGLIKATEKRK